MGIIDRFLKKEKLMGDWKTLKTAQDLANAVEESNNLPVVLFKHSTRCGLSAMVKYQLEKTWNFEPQDLSFYYLDLIKFRGISNQIADDFAITHQSPQAIILHNGKAIAHTSHQAVTTDWIHSNLEKV